MKDAAQWHAASPRRTHGDAPKKRGECQTRGVRGAASRLRPRRPASTLQQKDRRMLIDFLYALRSARLPVSVREYLTLLAALEAGVAGPRSAGSASLDDFYYLSRAALVKDERHYDTFDRAFASFFKGADSPAGPAPDLPADWLREAALRELTPEQKAAVEAMDWDELMETLRQRLAQQQSRHEGGSKWIGTGGTSPYGNAGFNPQGVRIGGASRGRSAVKVWERRAWRDYDDSQALGTRNLKVALRRLRKFARAGAQDELDLDHTIRATAANAGYLDIRMVPERHNQVKVLLLMDVGGTMDEHVQPVQALFSAARSEFKHLAFFYFHNCVYGQLWKNNRRRLAETFDTWDILRKYNRDYRLILIGDATMSPTEILQPGGSVEHHNAEPGAEWLRRLAQAFPHHAWINPEPRGLWQYRRSIALVGELMGGRMYPMTLAGLEQAMRALSK